MYIYIYIYTHVYICMYVCMNVCMYVYIYIYIYIRMVLQDVGFQTTSSKPLRAPSPFLCAPKICTKFDVQII